MNIKLIKDTYPNYKGDTVKAPSPLIEIIAVAYDGNLHVSVKGRTYRVVYGLATNDWDTLESALLDFNNCLIHLKQTKGFDYVP